MTTRKNAAILIGFVLAASLLSASVTAALLERYYGRVYMQTLGQICQSVIGHLADGGAEQTVFAALKEYRYDPADPTGQDMLLSYGYRPGDFLQSDGALGRHFAWTGAAAGGLLFLASFLFLYRRENARIAGLADYLEKVNTGRGGVLEQAGEDAFSGLQDEIYKTVTALWQTKDTALQAKNNFAENLYNIAHQLKTPITSISLSVQMLRSEIFEEPSGAPSSGRSAFSADEAAKQDSPHEGTEKERTARYLDRIAGQLTRLTRLEEGLLLLSRIDAGTLTLERKEVDVFTLLTLSAENLQELFRDEEIAVEIPEAGETVILADMDWTMEAVMNLLKNCMEHTPSGGMVRCVYEQNPLYTLIQIRDNGPGFAKEDLPRLFERFYRGKDAAGGGIGIGLSLARAIVEGQNGTLSAHNLPAGGACFEIRFYCH